MSKHYDCIVVGGGHAGCEAALASSQMGCKTLMTTLYFDTIGQMSCNPALGGVGKGQLVKEIDILGGAMGFVGDKTAIQFRQLNASKGQAVRSSRCQSDRKRYKLCMQQVIKDQENLDVLEDEACELLIKSSKIIGIRTKNNAEIKCKTLIITAGTFLNGRIHVGKVITDGGRVGEPASKDLAKSLENCGFEILPFKTGTPPRLDGKTINFQGLEVQHSDAEPIPFSYKTSEISAAQKLLPCHITYTNEKTHEIIRQNMHLSPMYSGQINATGVRYCPSIEDKLKKFSDKSRHQVFLEPEGLDTDEYYPNGISTGLPVDVQEQFIRSIKGLENVKINQFGYSIEHGIIHPTELKASLETKKISGLFLAGQVNGSTGYEEAASQGVMAGINAALKVKRRKPFILRRDEAYVGVLIDDLVTKGTEEPYRMFTSRVEYRLIVREDNADKRLAKYAYDFGLMNKQDYMRIKEKYEKINKEIKRLKTTRVYPSERINNLLQQKNSTPLAQPALLNNLLKRPEVNFDVIAELEGETKDYSNDIIAQIEYEIKYEGFIVRQNKEIEKFKNIENIKIPEGFSYENIPGLSIEISQKLKHFTPTSLGQASRISGVTPAAISILMIYLKKMKESKG